VSLYSLPNSLPKVYLGIKDFEKQNMGHTKGAYLTKTSNE